MKIRNSYCDILYNNELLVIIIFSYRRVRQAR